LDETKLKNPVTNEPLDIEPINICKPAEVKRNDQIYVIQYPLGGNLSLSASQCFVVGKDNQIACMIRGEQYFNNIVKLVFDDNDIQKGYIRIIAVSTTKWKNIMCIYRHNSTWVIMIFYMSRLT